MWLFLSVFGLGFLYFITAIPVAVAAGVSLSLAAGLAWFGYCGGTVLVTLLGVPLRTWIMKKMKLSLAPHSLISSKSDSRTKKFFWKAWDRYGLLGTALIAPVTVGPQIATLLLLALGQSPQKIILFISLGALPWVAFFVGMIKFGFHYFL